MSTPSQKGDVRGWSRCFELIKLRHYSLFAFATGAYNCDALRTDIRGKCVAVGTTVASLRSITHQRPIQTTMGNVSLPIVGTIVNMKLAYFLFAVSWTRYAVVPVIKLLDPFANC